MNLFSRLSEILEEVDEPKVRSMRSSRIEADRLMRTMEANLGRVQQSAVAAIAAERAAARELGRQLDRPKPNEVLVNRLQEEHARAALIVADIKETLREMREGLEQARRFRDTILRWRKVDEGKKLTSWRRIFWNAYHRICDLADEQLDQLEEQSNVIEKAGRHGPQWFSQRAQ